MAPITHSPSLVGQSRPALDPRLAAMAGALCISVSAMFVKLSGTSAGTAAFFRCALALPILVPLAVFEMRRARARGLRWRAMDLAAGAFLGVDFVLWAESIARIGAGIATVLVNVQVVIVPLVSFLVTGERPSRGFVLATPVLLAGVALSGGIADHDAFGTDPWQGVLFGTGAGVAYGGYLFLLRRGGNDEHRYSPVCLATVSAGVVALAVGGPWQGIDFAPGWQALGWLAALALSGQVFGWLIGSALPKLRSGVGGALLLLQPVAAILFGIVLLGERPGVWQLVGCGLVVFVIGLVTVRPQKPRAPAVPCGKLPRLWRRIRRLNCEVTYRPPAR